MLAASMILVGGPASSGWRPCPRRGSTAREPIRHRDEAAGRIADAVAASFIHLGGWLGLSGALVLLKGRWRLDCGLVVGMFVLALNWGLVGSVIVALLYRRL